MVETYLSKRNTLKAVVLIIDIRRIPGSEEFSLIQWLSHMDIPWVPVLTKADKLPKTKQLKQQRSIGKALSVEENELILFPQEQKRAKKMFGKPLNDLSAIFRRTMTASCRREKYKPIISCKSSGYNFLRLKVYDKNQS